MLDVESRQNQIHLPLTGVLSISSPIVFEITAADVWWWQALKNESIVFAIVKNSEDVLNASVVDA